jgi:hypothetical protein
MWDKVKRREHNIVKVFPASFEDTADKDDVEFMMFGTVAYQLKTGEDVVTDWVCLLTQSLLVFRTAYQKFFFCASGWACQYQETRREPSLAVCVLSGLPVVELGEPS